MKLAEALQERADLKRTLNNLRERLQRVALVQEGVRPEFIHICDDGPIEGEVFSAMPTGMETTVRIRVGNYLLTGVVFGGVIYKIGQKIRLAFAGDGATLFSRVNGRLVGCGELKIG